MSTILKLENICKHYDDIVVLDNLILNIELGKFHVIMGHSGSGKTTLMNILGLLDKQTQGSIQFKQEEIGQFSEKKKSKIRMKEVGFIFQEFYLNNTLKAYENVMIPMFINPAYQSKDLKRKSIEILTSLGLGERTNHFPKMLSGGEKQRVAIARALANNPTIILADEPTGNLDKSSEAVVLSTLKNLSLSGKAVVVVSHTPEVLKYADVVYEMKDGKLIEVNHEY